MMKFFKAVDREPSGSEPGALLLMSLFCWVLISALYYITFLLLGDIDAGYGKNFLHKVFKYVAVFFLSTAFLLRSRRFFLWACLFFFEGVIVAVFLSGFEYVARIDGLLVIISMFGLVMVLNSLAESQINLLERMIVLSAVVVGFFAIVEVLFLSDVYGEHWRRTGGIRLVSTLYNPNNMGVYTGASFIVLLFSKMSLSVKALAVPFIIFALIMSGSRTAWLSGMLTLGGYFFFCSGQFFISKKILFSVFCGGGVLGVILLMGFDLPFSSSRLYDFQSAFIRIERYTAFLKNINESYIFPDLEGVRAGLVSESAYFTLLNSLGFLGAVILVLFFMMFLSFRSQPTTNIGWRVVFWFYIVAGLFENILNSFPNNQMFFISLGAYFLARRDFSVRAVK